MWSQLSDALLPHFTVQRSGELALVCIKTTLVYLFLVLALRLAGKRSLGQMNLYDLILIIVLANSVQNAMVGDDTTLGGGIVAGVTLMVLNRLFNHFLHHSKKLEQAMVGNPVLLVHEGHCVKEHMEKEQVTHEQIMEAVREHGMDQLSDVKSCVLEVDGTLSIIPGDARTHHTRRRFKALKVH